jgi:hypothetical protein
MIDIIAIFASKRVLQMRPSPSDRAHPFRRGGLAFWRRRHLRSASNQFHGNRLSACRLSNPLSDETAENLRVLSTKNVMSEQYALCVILPVKAEHADEFAAMVQENVTGTRKDKGVVTSTTIRWSERRPGSFTRSGKARQIPMLTGSSPKSRPSLRRHPACSQANPRFSSWIN